MACSSTQVKSLTVIVLAFYSAYMMNVYSLLVIKLCSYSEHAHHLRAPLSSTCSLGQCSKTCLLGCTGFDANDPPSPTPHPLMMPLSQMDVHVATCITAHLRFSVLPTFLQVAYQHSQFLCISLQQEKLLLSQAI